MQIPAIPMSGLCFIINNLTYRTDQLGMFLEFLMKARKTLEIMCKEYFPGIRGFWLLLHYIKHDRFFVIIGHEGLKSLLIILEAYKDPEWWQLQQLEFKFCIVHFVGFTYNPTHAISRTPVAGTDRNILANKFLVLNINKRTFQILYYVRIEEKKLEQTTTVHGENILFRTWGGFHGSR